MKDLPREIRRWACQVRREVTDRLTGRHWSMVGPGGSVGGDGSAFSSQLNLEQRILPTDFVEAKIHNLELAVARMQNVTVPAGRIFSFWRMVDRPTQSRGFQPGRSLLGGRLQADYGGGLCQLSGILYHLSLQAGLTILERHPHSRDIYSDAERYAPLGSDATVAYGFKDLRVLNNLSAAICFRVSVSPDNLSARLCSPASVKPHIVEFIQTSERGGCQIVETRRHRPEDRNCEIVNISTYTRII